MSNYRIATLIAQESAITPATKTVDLKGLDPLSKIQIIFKATSAGTAQTAHPAQNVSKVEVVDGSNVLWSLTGKEIQALDYHNTRQMPYNALINVSGVQAIATLNLNFGRYRMDPSLALDTTRFDNPQLKITHNALTMDASASAATVEAYGWLFDKKKPSPVGFLMGKEHFGYTPAGSGTIQELDLPKDHVTRKYLVMAYAAGYYLWDVANNIRISENMDQSVWFDMKTSAWMKTIYGEFPRATEYGMMPSGTGGYAIYAAPSFDLNISPNSDGNLNYFKVGYASEKTPLTVTAAAAGTPSFVVTGLAPHAAIPVYTGDQMNMDDWYDVTGLGALKMRITAGTYGSSGTVQVVTEQLRKY